MEMEFSQEEEWIGYLFQSATPDERVMYRHWYTLRATEPPERLLARYKELFLEGKGYVDHEIRKVLVNLVKADINGRSLLPVINCCSYMLANHWRVYPSEHFAITELVKLFDNVPNKTFFAPEGNRLRELVTEYSNSQDLRELRQFADLYRPDDQLFKATSIRETLSHFPFLYKTPEMIPSAWYKFHATAIKDMYVSKEIAKEKELLPYYLAWENGHPMPSLAGSSLLLRDRELVAAFDTCAGNVDSYGSHAQGARYFKKKVCPHLCSYVDFIERFCDFLLSPVVRLVALGAVPSTVLRKLRTRICEFLNQDTSNRSIFLSNQVIVSVCQRLMRFLTIEDSSSKQHYIFTDVQTHLGNAATVGLLLRLVLFCKAAKSDMERGLARLFKHYQDEAVTGGGADWLIPILEHINIAFATNFGKYAFRNHRAIVS